MGCLIHMQKLNILTRRQVKDILKLIKNRFGASVDLDYAFLQNDKGKIYIINSDISKIDLEKVRMNSLGLYFGEVHDNMIRLSIEGSGLVGPYARKNVIELSDSDSKRWLSGQDLDVSDLENGYYLIRNKKDFYGCGKVKDNKLFNYVSKSRRINS